MDMRGPADRPESYARRRHINGFFLFLLSAILPGLNYMYLGLMKRGLFFLSAFFVLAGFGSSLGFSFLYWLIPLIWITGFFDAFEKKRRIEAGEYVEDNVDEILNFLRKHWVPIVVVIIIAVGASFLRDAGDMLMHWMHPIPGGGFIRNGLRQTGFFVMNSFPFIMICVGLFFIAKVYGKRKRRRKSEHDDEPVDYRRSRDE